MNDRLFCAFIWLLGSLSNVGMWWGHADEIIGYHAFLAGVFLVMAWYDAENYIRWKRRGN